jgi:6-pyruvoyltetrahydropterin/6-carboxytetrahydropterin synthase
LSTFPEAESIALQRTVRVGIPFPKPRELKENEVPQARRNGFAGIPPSDGFTAHHEVTVECVGMPDRSTGYLVGIQELDAVVRTHVFPLLQAFCEGPERITPLDAVRLMSEAVMPTMPAHAEFRSLTWSPGPFITYSWRTDMPTFAVMTESFEFSAAHRLHCPELSDEENRRTFGKCNHPSGHGHNYRIAVAARVPTGAGAGSFGSAAMEAIVMRTVIDRFDHKHLNLDCAEFAKLNPSVENIAMVCHGLLAPELATAGVEIDHVTVWETEKTSATYPVR